MYKVNWPLLVRPGSKTVSASCCACPVTLRHTLDPEPSRRLFRDVMAALSPKNVVTALKSLSIAKIRKLVFYLNVQLRVLEDIDMEYSGTNRNMKYVEAWLECDTDASWTKLVSGLQDIDLNVLAEEVETKYISKSEEASVCSASATPPPVQLVSSPAPVPVSFAMTTAAVGPLTPALNPTQSPAVNMGRVAEVRAKIGKFEKEFAHLNSDVRAFLSDKESKDAKFLAVFRDHLIDLPVSKRALHARFFYKNEDEIFKAGTIERIFAILRRYCNYSNYDIILHLVETFCDAALKKKMRKYCDSFDSFEEVTTVDIYLCAISVHPKSDVYRAFSKMVMTIDKPACECTLHEIRHLRESLAESADIHSYSAYIECMTTNSVLVVLRIPPSCVVWVGVAITPEFMQAHHLTDVSIDGKDITSYQEKVCYWMIG